MSVDKPRKIYIVAKQSQFGRPSNDFLDLEQKLQGFGFVVANPSGRGPQPPVDSMESVRSAIDALLDSDAVVVTGKLGEYQRCFKAFAEAALATWSGKKMMFMFIVDKQKDPDLYLFDYLTA